MKKLYFFTLMLLFLAVSVNAQQQITFDAETSPRVVNLDIYQGSIQDFEQMVNELSIAIDPTNVLTTEQGKEAFVSMYNQVAGESIGQDAIEGLIAPTQENYQAWLALVPRAEVLDNLFEKSLLWTIVSNVGLIR